MALDLESVRLFVLAADLGNLTRAAEAAGTVQPIVSQRLKTLEAAVGYKLLERSPRFVRLTPRGSLFLGRARPLLSAHEAALNLDDRPAVRIGLGMSDHAVGVALEQVLRHVRAAVPSHATIDVRVDLSVQLREQFDAGEMDAVIIRREGRGKEGEVLGLDPLGWRAAEGFVLPMNAPVPLATRGPACGVRAVAARALDRAGLSWHETFVGGSCAMLLAAARAGAGVAPMGRLASGSAPDKGPTLGLPPLPESQIVLLARTGSTVVTAAVRALEAAVRASIR
jgi:DNA-binding transcriptional LysR family regulator